VFVLIAVGVLVLFFRRDKWHYALWITLAAYWEVGGQIKSVLGNSTPYQTASLNLIVGLFAVWVTGRTRTLWPLVIGGLMVLSMLNDAAFIYYDTKPFIYQSGTFLLFYLSLFTLGHPTVRRTRHVERNWVYI
jgi:hypothetical protein